MALTKSYVVFLEKNTKDTVRFGKQIYSDQYSDHTSPPKTAKTDYFTKFGTKSGSVFQIMINFIID